MPINPDLQLTTHFGLKEFLHDGSPEGVTVTILENLRTLAGKLERVRSLLGGRRIHINSGFRTEAHNREVGGVKGSQHTYGRAADIVVEGLTPQQVQTALKEWEGGMGSYSKFTHVDIWTKRRWSGQ